MSAASEPPTGAPVAISDERIDALDTFALYALAPLGRESVRAFARALLAEARAPGAVPEGWKLVPIEATRAMLDAAFTYRGALQHIPMRPASYRALLAAAPAPPIKAQAGEPKP